MVPWLSYYADNDYDTFGDPSDSLIQCEQPVDYVTNNNDCDDTDDQILEQFAWYADVDGDGFGDLTSKKFSCTQPDGYIADFTDCDDNDADKNPLVMVYLDNDGDGFGTPDSSVSICQNLPQFVTNSDDCNDTDKDVNPNSIWYYDEDNDNYGDTSQTYDGCEPPENYVLIKGDNCPATYNPDQSDSDNNGKGDACDELTTAVSDNDIKPLPDVFSLGQNYPNPFNAETMISFALPEKSFVNLSIYNLLGQKITTLVNSFYPAGHHQVLWNGQSDQGFVTPSGIYLYRMETNIKSFTRKLIMLK